MRAKCTSATLSLALIFGALVPCVHAEPSGYGQVDTFQPGKKYNCVPASDGKGWDCKEIGKADAAANSAESASPKVKPADSASMPSTSSSATPLEKAARIDTSAETTTPASSLPSYLTGASTAGNSRPSPAPAPAVATASSPPVSARAKHATHATQAPATSVVNTKKVVPTATPHLRTQSTRPTSESTPAKPERIPRHANAPEAAPLPAPRAPIAPRADTAPVAQGAGSASQRDFLALAGDQYVIELAHAEREGELAAIHDAAQVPSGNVYELHLRQNGADQWLLVWGDFESIEAARAARATLLGAGTITPGWPRRIAPLQTELRRAQE